MGGTDGTGGAEPDPCVERVPIELPGRDCASKNTVLPLAALCALTDEIGRSSAPPRRTRRPKLSVVGLGPAERRAANELGRVGDPGWERECERACRGGVRV